MERIWQSAPAAAVRVWNAEGSEARIEPNAAAVRWALRRGLSADPWRELTRREWPAAADQEMRLTLGTAGWTLHCRRIQLSDGFLLWIDADVIVQDPIELQTQQRLLQHERERSRFALEAAEVGIWERALDGVIVYWNDVMYRLRGLDPADRRTPQELAEMTSGEEDRLGMDQLVRRHVETGVPYRWEFPVRHKDGSTRWLLTLGRVVRAPDGRPLRIAGINLDVTERRTAEALRAEKERAEQANRDKSAFLARVSHELRTPMNAVLGFARLMEDDVRDPPSATQRLRLQRVRAAGAELMGLIDGVLEVSREGSPSAEKAQLEDRPEPLRVLCVEDNPVNLLLVRELLAMRPEVRLLEAMTGMEGMAIARSELPDVLLLDVQLPDLSGLEVMRRLRQEPTLQGARFIALSADAMPSHIDAALAAGFDDYWTKPIHFDRFLAGIDRMSAERQASSARPPADVDEGGTAVPPRSSAKA